MERPQRHRLTFQVDPRPEPHRLTTPAGVRHTYDGWLWLDAYQLDPKGEAVARRELFVLRAGVRRQAPGEARRPAPARRRTAARAV
ncbi:hypothetical protein ACIP95_03305 [Micromonospora parva]|uniref:hypothetical protein n=1 Tax=Micromonospora parva TaxID=1464048 RepID=UPI0033C5B572